MSDLVPGRASMFYPVAIAPKARTGVLTSPVLCDTNEFLQGSFLGINNNADLRGKRRSQKWKNRTRSRGTIVMSKLCLRSPEKSSSECIKTRRHHEVQSAYCVESIMTWRI